MRILAVRGCNLASLAGEFEIDLAHGTLGGAGVFAIVGPTGAGKSTLLDAICVALFDRTPRLANRSTVVVGRGADDPAALGAQDVRTILRRGATAGYAEVDFESGDARCYRARWSVRRARDRSDGNLQAQQITLSALDGERFGGTRSETLEAIHDRLGLSFDQFRRSALLAQGEFAAFLRADGRDRSELLERMTGTEIYSRLSMAAHARAGLAEQAAREGRAALGAIAVLDDEARAGLARDHAAAVVDARAARERSAGLAAMARWSEEARARVGARDGAAAMLVAATERVAAAGARRETLALRRRAERVRAPWESRQAIARRLAQARSERAAAAAAEVAACDRHAALVARRSAVADLSAPIRAGRIAAGLVERAVSRDAGLVVVREGDGRGATGRDGDVRGPAGRDADRERDVVGGGGPVDAAALVRAVDDAAWIVERPALGDCVSAWPELEVRFAQRVELAEDLARDASAERGIVDQRERLVRGREGHVVEQQARAARVAEIRVRAASWKQRRGLSLDEARRAEDAARVDLVDAERLVAIAAGAREAARVEAELARQLAELDAAVAADAGARGAAEAAIERGGIARAEREAIVADLRRAAGYAHARAELVAGDPCPLCGAAEHPWRERGALDDVVAAAEARLAEIRGAIERASHQLANLAARGPAQARERARLVAHGETARASIAAATPSWCEQLAALHELVFERDPASAEAERIAAGREGTAARRLEAARAAREHVEASAKAANAVQAELVVGQADLEHVAQQIADVDRRIAELDIGLERTRAERASRVARDAELANDLAAGLARWRTAGAPLDTDAAIDGARAALRELAIEWSARCERVARADATLAAALAVLESEASALAREVAEHAARRAETERHVGNFDLEHADAEAALATALAEADLTDTRAGELLDASPTTHDALADELAALDREVERAAALVAERERRIGEHATARPIVEGLHAHDAPRPAPRVGDPRLGDHDDARTEAGDPRIGEHDDARTDAGDPRLGERAEARICEGADWGTRASAAEAEAARLDERRARLAEALDADARAIERRAGTEAALADAEREAEVDRILGEVIGSHDGKVFRSFAQSLTLDSLLAVANAHLGELAPRYQLERIPRQDLELQVIDRDLGSEVRSIQSLSGGESFLVSLALALGLSSMSAHDVRVRTLLIDEGFGSLDPVTLDGALAVLDRLQASGCQVGVISHVPALVERVGAHVRVAPRGGGRSEVIVGQT